MSNTELNIYSTIVYMYTGCEVQPDYNRWGTWCARVTYGK